MIEALALYLAAGIFAGFVPALFGVGGGLTLVPTLIVGPTLQRMPADHLVHMTAGTALSVMVFTAGYAAWLRWRAGALLGAPAGIRLSHRIDDHLQGRLFTACLCVVLAVMLAHTWSTAG